MIAGVIGHGAALRRPDIYTKYLYRGDGIGTAPKELLGHSSNGYRYSTYRKFISKPMYNVSTPYSADFTLGTSNFTLECFVYRRTYYNQEISLLTQYTDASNQNKIYINQSTHAVNVYAHNGTWTFVNFSGGSISEYGRWYHVAVVRNGTTFSIYVDGTLAASSNPGALYNLVNFSPSCNMFGFNSGDYTVGDCCQLSIGIAKYTSNFTPPTRRY